MSNKYYDHERDCFMTEDYKKKLLKDLIKDKEILGGDTMIQECLNNISEDILRPQKNALYEIGEAIKLLRKKLN